MIPLKQVLSPQDMEAIFVNLEVRTRGQRLYSDLHVCRTNWKIQYACERMTEWQADIINRIKIEPSSLQKLQEIKPMHVMILYFWPEIPKQLLFHLIRNFIMGGSHTRVGDYNGFMIFNSGYYQSPLCPPASNRSQHGQWRKRIGEDLPWLQREVGAKASLCREYIVFIVINLL